MVGLRESPTNSSTMGDDARLTTLWGLTPSDLYDAYWRARGVQIIRLGTNAPLERGAELFMLLQPGQLVLFDLQPIIERFIWRKARLSRVRIVDEHIEQYSERLQFDDVGNVRSIERRYRPSIRGATRVLLTTSRRLASAWMCEQSPREAWKQIRRQVPWSCVDHLRVQGDCFRESNDIERDVCIKRIAERWTQPNQAIDGIEEDHRGVWSLIGSKPVEAALVVGPVWAGSGSLHDPEACVVGPAWMPDREPCTDGATALIRPIHQIELAATVRDNAGHAAPGWGNSMFKRAIDIVVSLVGLMLILPSFPLIMLAIFLEDGRPVFFGHARQTRGGRSFRCWKFRTMVHDAGTIRQELHEKNQADGPQFYIEDDPRITRVGRVLRNFHLDELPQLWNVLIGQMSLVGPRPSPDDENQYCPAWRDTRLSVRPGMTGLWQLLRTRREGADFQEWIKYDIQYVRTASLTLDLKILARTVWSMIRRG